MTAILLTPLCLFLSCSMGSVPFGVHDKFLVVGPFHPVRRQSVEGADILVAQSTRSSVHFLFRLSLFSCQRDDVWISIKNAATSNNTWQK